MESSVEYLNVILDRIGKEFVTWKMIFL